MACISTRAPSAIHPDSLYSRRGFIIASGISETRLREARMAGLEPRKLWVGKRCYFRGSDIIGFIELLAAEEIRRDTTYLEPNG